MREYVIQVHMYTEGDLWHWRGNNSNCRLYKKEFTQLLLLFGFFGVKYEYCIL